MTYNTNTRKSSLAGSLQLRNVQLNYSALSGRVAKFVVMHLSMLSCWRVGGGGALIGP